MKETVTIVKSVGKYGVNRSSDVSTIQTRLNKWIAYGRLPGLSALIVDGQCGQKTKTAIGAFQLRYVMGVTKPDCRCDAGGATVTHMGLDFSEGPKATPGDPVYDGWLKVNTDVDDGAPYWEKRGPLWVGGGLKGSVGGIDGGMDFSLLTLFNEQDVRNHFQVSVSTQRTHQLGGGVSGSLVLCICTGIYHPNDLHGIVEQDWDFNVALFGKWSALAKGVSKIPKIGSLIGEAKLAKYADLGVVSSVITQLKAKSALDGLDWGNPDFNPLLPRMIIIDTPAGAGIELSIYTTLTKYSVIHKNLL